MNDAEFVEVLRDAATAVDNAVAAADAAIQVHTHDPDWVKKHGFRAVSVLASRDQCKFALLILARQLEGGAGPSAEDIAAIWSGANVKMVGSENGAK